LYWQGLLRELRPRGTPLADRQPSPGQAHQAGRARFRLEPEVTALVRQQCRALRTTPFTLLATVLAALLGNSDGPDGPGEVMLGTPVTRRTAETEGLVGCLTDLLPLRLAAPPGATFAEAAGSTREAVQAALAQPGVPYLELVKRAAPRRALKGQPLCPCVLVVDDARRAPLALAGLSAERVYVAPEVAKFPLCLTLVRQGTSYLWLLDYSRDLYGARTGQRIATGFQLLLGAALRERGAPLGRLMASTAPEDHIPGSAR
jgi:non-ribosomal peptide synthetase component F